MNINVQFGERCINMEVSPNETVGDVKKRLSEITNIGCDSIDLTANKRNLQDIKPLQQYAIKEGSTLTMTSVIALQIVDLDERYPIEILSDASVTDLREKISEVDELKELKDYGLVFGEEHLEDGVRLARYQIKQDSEIAVVRAIKLMIKFHEKNFSVNITPSAKVAELTKKLSEIIKTNTENIILKLESVLLLEDKTLTKYQLKNDSEIILFIKMRVLVNYCGECTEIESTSENTFDEVKTQMSMRTGIGIGLIHLYLNGQEMRNEDLLGQHFETNKMELVMRVKMSLVIQFCDKDYKIETFTDETISNLKKKIRAQIKESVNEIILCNNETLSDGEMIKDSQIKDNSRLVIKTKNTIAIEFCGVRSNIDAYSDDRILELKKQLAVKYKIEENRIYLYFENKSVDNNVKLYTFNPQITSIFKMREKVKVTVIFCGENFELELFSDEKVSALKSKISKKKQVKVDFIELKLNQIFLENGKSLHKIPLKGAILILIVKMKICVTFGEKKYEMEYMSNSKVKDLKIDLEKEMNIKISNIHLEISGRKMTDEDELGMYGMSFLYIKMRDKIKLFFTNGSKTYNFECFSDISVNELKQMIKLKIGTKEEHDVDLSLNGMILNAKDTLQSIEIKGNNTINIITKLAGGIYLEYIINREN